MAGVPAGYEFSSDDSDDFMFDYRKEPKNQCATIPETEQPTAHKLSDEVTFSQELIKTVISIQNTEEFESLLNSGLSHNFILASGWSLLSYSLLLKKYKIADILLDRMEDVDLGSCGCLMSMAYALYENTTEMQVGMEYARKLIKLGAGVNYRNNDGKTCLMVAVVYSNINIAYILLEHKADIHQTDHNKKSVLKIVISNNKLEFLQLIMSYIKNLEDPLPNELCTESVYNYKTLFQDLLSNEYITYQIRTYLANMIHKGITPKFSIEKYLNNVGRIRNTNSELHSFLSAINCEHLYEPLKRKKVTLSQLFYSEIKLLCMDIEATPEEISLIEKCCNEMLVFGLDDGVFTGNCDNFNIFDVVVSISNISKHLSLMNAFLPKLVQRFDAENSAIDSGNEIKAILNKSLAEAKRDCQEINTKLSHFGNERKWLEWEKIPRMNTKLITCAMVFGCIVFIKKLL